MAAAVVVVLVTVPNKAVARRLAQVLVRGRLAACVNIVPGVESHYTWQGQIEQAAELLLMIKTTARRLPALQRAVRAGHPYASPEVIALPVRAGLASYLSWVRRSVT